MTVSIGMSTGAALNPSKVIGPGLVGKSYWPILPYLVGIIGGTIAGGILCEYILFTGVQGSVVQDENKSDPEEDDYERELPSYIRENDNNDVTIDIRDDRDPDEERETAEADVSNIMSDFGDD